MAQTEHTEMYDKLRTMEQSDRLRALEAMLWNRKVEEDAGTGAPSARPRGSQRPSARRNRPE